jgi:hypothetical protein
LLVSYSYDQNWKGQLCCANLDSLGYPNEMRCIREFQAQSFITSLGSARELNENTEQFISYIIRSCDPKAAENFPCNEVLYKALLGRSKTLSVFKDKSITPLLNRPSGAKKYKSAFNRNLDTQTLCWIHSKNNVLLFGGIEGIFKYGADDETAIERNDRPLYELTKYEQVAGSADQVTRVGNYISSNILDIGDGKIQFIEAPYLITKPSTENNALKKAFNLYEGSLVTLGLNGKIIDKIPFPALPLGQKAILSQRHWCFADLKSNQFIVTATLKQPKEYTVLRFSDNQLLHANTTLNLNFNILAVSPNRQYLLCSRNVVPKSIPEAKKKGIPLCELGIVKVPFSLE